MSNLFITFFNQEFVFTISVKLIVILIAIAFFFFWAFTVFDKWRKGLHRDEGYWNPFVRLPLHSNPIYMQGQADVKYFYEDQIRELSNDFHLLKETYNKVNHFGYGSLLKTISRGFADLEGDSGSIPNEFKKNCAVLLYIISLIVRNRGFHNVEEFNKLANEALPRDFLSPSLKELIIDVINGKISYLAAADIYYHFINWSGWRGNKIQEEIVERIKDSKYPKLFY